MTVILPLTNSCIKLRLKEPVTTTTTPELPRDLSSPDQELKRAPLIRVLLLKNVATFNIAADTPFTIYSIKNKFTYNGNGKLTTHNTTSSDIKPIEESLKEYDSIVSSVVELTDSHILLGNERFERDAIKIVPSDGEIKINETNYSGDIMIIPQLNDKFLVIEETYVENFLSGVVSSEVPMSWAEDTILAQTVTARTFTLYQKKRHDTEAYHIRKLDLAYKGKSNESAIAVEAVKKSEGIIMVYDQQIFPGYFHSTCGGHTEDAGLVFKKKSIPPLAGVPCGYCEDSKYYRWSREINKNEIVKKLYKSTGNSNSLISLKPIDIGPGGHAGSIKIHTSKKEHEMNANVFRLQIGPKKLLSTAFTISNNGKKVKINGRGWGHGVGLCQFGSQKMGTLGFKWENILKHYYPGIDLIKAY